MWSGLSLIRVTVLPLSFSLQHLTERSLAYGFQMCLKAMKPVNWDRFSKVPRMRARIIHKEQKENQFGDDRGRW